MRVRIEFLYFSLWTHPHPPRIRSAPSPIPSVSLCSTSSLKGEACGRPRCAAPTGKNGGELPQRREKKSPLFQKKNSGDQICKERKRDYSSWSASSLRVTAKLSSSSCLSSAHKMRAFCGDPLESKCSGEMNSPCAKVLPWRAKRLYGAYAPPHLRWGPFVDDWETLLLVVGFFFPGNSQAQLI